MSETLETSMFLNAYIDIPDHVRNGAKEMKAAQQHISAALLLTISILALTPTLADADQSQSETFAIVATGQATAIGSGLSGATTLNLTGLAYKNSNQWLIIQNATGLLKIASTNFMITGGHGSVSKVGAAAIFADTASAKGQLILQGTMSGNTVTFRTPSQLASTSYLDLSGTFAPTAEQTASVTTNSVNSGKNTTSLVTSHVNGTQQINFTSTTSTSILQNITTEAVNTSLAIAANVQVSNTTATLVNTNTITTNTSIGNSTLPTLSNRVEQHNVTIHVVQGEGEICLSSRYLLPVCATASQTVAVKDGDLVNFDSDANSGFTWDHYDGLGNGQGQNFNANITQDAMVGVYFAPDVSGTISLPADNVTTTSTAVNSNTTTPISDVTIPVPGNVTVTQYANPTIFVTQTVANYTISYTVTSTVANTTITRANTTITVNGTTTVSNMTRP